MLFPKSEVCKYKMKCLLYYILSHLLSALMLISNGKNLSIFDVNDVNLIAKSIERKLNITYYDIIFSVNKYLSYKIFVIHIPIH